MNKHPITPSIQVCTVFSKKKKNQTTLVNFPVFHKKKKIIARLFLTLLFCGIGTKIQ